MKHNTNKNDAIMLSPGQGRVYDCGSMKAIFKADENETDEKYSVSEWWIEPHSDGPGAHQHDHDHVFYVLEGTTSILVGDKWIEADRGTCIRIPAKTIHDFANRTDKRTGILSFSIPGGFEKEMPAIVKWFDDSEDLEKALQKDKTAWDHYGKLSPSHKKEYIKWITEAKKEETRISRIQKAVEKLRSGQRLK